MSLQNLSEQHLYSLLPDGLISLDDQGLIAAVTSGVQDRFDDARSFISKGLQAIGAVAFDALFGNAYGTSVPDGPDPY
jgi:hypothetical protein